MTAVGLVVLFMGAGVVVAEVHAAGGVFGVAGGVALIAGGIVVIAALGGGAALAVPVGVGLGAAAGGWALVATRKAAGVRRMRIRSGAGALCGPGGGVRSCRQPGGPVFGAGSVGG